MDATIVFEGSQIQPLCVPFANGKAAISSKALTQKANGPHVLKSLCARVVDESGGVLLLPLDVFKDINEEPLFILESSISSEYVVHLLPTSIDHSAHVKRNEGCITVSSSGSSSKETQDPTDNSKRTRPNNSECSDESVSEGRSVIPTILDKQGACILKRLLRDATSILTIDELPRTYNGNVVFEFPPTFGKRNSMDGMEQKFDGHIWTKPVTTNVSFVGNVRLSYCGGVFECVNVSCPRYVNTHKQNRCSFKGSIAKKCGFGFFAEGDKMLTCSFCKRSVVCKGTCSCMAYYVMPADINLSRLFIHVGNHSHETQPGSSKRDVERVRKMVERIVHADRNLAPRNVQMKIAKELITTSVTRRPMENERTIGDLELSDLLEVLAPLVENRRLRRVVASVRGPSTSVGDSVDLIFRLKRDCKYDFFQGSKFPDQCSPGERCYLFKMSTMGPASGVDIVNRMRRSGQGDLRRSWIQFDHTRRVRDWTTMACHVYDPSIQELMTVATCEMKEEDTHSQIIFWEMLNSVMLRTGHESADFHGFMADEAQANWRAVRTVFNGGPDKVMEQRERSCLFHWKQSLQIHTTKYVVKDHQAEHVSLCENWRQAESKEEATTQFRVITQWWRTGKVRANDIPAMDSWISWWGIRIAHWGEYMVQVTDAVEGANTPRTNLSESKHGSWLAGEGRRSIISLYDACVSDLASALLQSAKQNAYSMGKHLGEGPSLQNLMQRSHLRKGHRPRTVSDTVNNSMFGTPMYHQPNHVEGDTETVRRKRRPCTSFVIDDNASHRPEYNYDNVQRGRRGRPKKINFDTDRTATELEVKVTAEQDVHKSQWAIRRTQPNSRVKCLGMIPGRGLCGRPVPSSARGAPAPSFYGSRKHANGTTQQFMWFCSDDYTHTWVPSKGIFQMPPKVPNIWPVARGTDLTETEVGMLTRNGFILNVTPMESRDAPTSLHRAETQQGCDEQFHGAGPSDPPPPGDSENLQPTRRFKTRTGISAKAQERINRSLSMDVDVKAVKCIKEGHHIVFSLVTSNLDHQGQYEVSISRRPTCTCPDFQARHVEGRSYLACKHLYYVFLVLMGLDQISNMFIHQPSLTEIEVFQALSRAKKYL